MATDDEGATLDVAVGRSWVGLATGVSVRVGATVGTGPQAARAMARVVETIAAWALARTAALVIVPGA